MRPQRYVRPELLAPAGGWEQLEFAIRFGADAVYLASGRFGMRQRAQNFSEDELPAVVAYAHERGAKVHVTCNIVMHEDDIAELPAFFERVDAAGVDALIIGDLGALRLAREHAPHVALHASTQASVSNAQAALVWHELGASRIVCAREMSLAGIARMRRELPDDLELEAFVHGSMCMAYSGRCLISDFLTGRSALSGNCAQSCRWNYTLEEELRPGEHYPIEQDSHGSYIMNARDLNMLSHLAELAAAGIDSVKIEGRNKKAFYVATVVNAYRQVLDGADPADFEPELDAVSHRPYSTGFYFGPAHQQHDSDAREQAWEWAAEVVSCEPAPGAGGRWRARVRIRNSMRAGQELQVLSPHRPVFDLDVARIWHLPEGEDGTGLPPYEVQVANRGMELYLLDCNAKLRPHDIVRKRKAPQQARDAQGRGA